MKEIEEYIEKSDWRINENANTGFSISGLKSYISSTILARDSLSLLPRNIRDAHKNGEIHIHDLDGSLYSPYSYLKDVCIWVDIDGEVLYIPMENLFLKFEKYSIKTNDIEYINFDDIFIEYITYRASGESYCNNINIGYKKLNIKVFDGKNGFVRLNKINRHLTDKNVLQINTSDGRIICVTEDHPMILSDNSIKYAESLQLNEELKIDNTLPKIEEQFFINEKISYIIGYAIGDGFVNTNGNLLYITGNNLDYIVKLLKELNLKYHISGRKNSLSSNINYILYINGGQFARFYKDVCDIKSYASNKNLPTNIFQWSKKSIGSLISGLIDSDGYVIKNGLIHICMSAYSVISGLKDLLRLLGIESRIRFHTNSNNLKGIKSNYDMWTISFRIIKGMETYFNLSQKIKISEYSKYDNFKNSKNVVHRIKKLYRNIEYVYDITTETTTFVSGGLKLHNCFGADLQQLMFEGLKNPVGSMSHPAKHFDTVVDHMVNYLYMSQNEFNGAQSFSNVDTLLSGYIIGQNYDYVKQCIQRLIYNISYPLRSAFQTPFVNFSFDLIPPKHMKNEPVLIGGKTSESLTYNDMQKEMDMINKAFLEIMLKGDSQSKPFTFPIPTYSITNDLLNKNDEVTNLLWQLSAKFGNPNFMNYIGTNADPSDVRAMCCRLSLDISKLRGRGLWNMGNKTGSLGVVTLNLNQASKNGEDYFIEHIDDYFELAIQELLIKRKYIYKAFNKGLLPFTKCYLNNKDPFATFFNTIGVHAMNEACLNMFEETIEFHQDFVEKTLDHLRKRTDETTNETGILFNLEQTPCEGATYRLAKLDKKFGLPTQGLENPFLTNSTHCAVNTIFDWTATVKIQERFNKYYSGGTIMHGFTGEDISSEYAEKIIKQMAVKTTIPYYNLTPTYSICQDHGRFTGKVEKCPICNNMNYIYSRVVGYLQPVQKWNKGKQEEFKMRKEYILG